MLRDEVEDDICRVFLDGEGFASLHDVNGEQVMCVVDEGTRGDRDLSSGLASESAVLFARSGDVPPAAPGSAIVIDGRTYMMESRRDDLGMAEICLIRSM